MGAKNVTFIPIPKYEKSVSIAFLQILEIYSVKMQCIS